MIITQRHAHRKLIQSNGRLRPASITSYGFLFQDKAIQQECQHRAHVKFDIFVPMRSCTVRALDLLPLSLKASRKSVSAQPEVPHWVTMILVSWPARDIKSLGMPFFTYDPFRRMTKSTYHYIGGTESASEQRELLYSRFLWKNPRVYVFVDNTFPRSALNEIMLDGLLLEVSPHRHCSAY